MMYKCSEAVDIMYSNIDKVLERSQKLQEMDDRAEYATVQLPKFFGTTKRLDTLVWRETERSGQLGVEQIQT